MAEGDLSALGDRELSAEEQGMVRRVAEEWANEVEGFQASALYEAYTYCYGNVSEPVVRQVQEALAPEEDEVEGYSSPAYAAPKGMAPSGMGLGPQPAHVCTNMFYPNSGVCSFNHTCW